MAIVNKEMYDTSVGLSGGTTKAATTGKWTSYQDAANAGFSNIRTQSEFARGGSDLIKYGTYQAYLDAMYDKYMGTPTVTAPAAPVPSAGGTSGSVTPSASQMQMPTPITYGEALENGGNQQEQAQTPEASPAVPAETTPSPVSSGSTINTDDPIMSYEEWYRKQNEEFAGIRDDTIAYYDEQNRKAIEQAEESRKAADAQAEEQKNLYEEAVRKAKETAYTAAEQQLMADLDFSKTQYQLLVESINAAKESGLALAAEQRDLLLKMSEEQKTAVYAAAEAQREQEYKEAEIARQRSVVDARSNYEQNKATYGARAEAAGDMGLSVSGYTDFFNQQAYATQRAETYAANSEAEAAKRAARYTENQQKFAADQDYAQNQYAAQSQYGKDKYAVETSYQQNMLAADQQKGQRDYEADTAERNAKNAADQAYIENKYNSDSKYSENLYKSGEAERAAKYAADAEASKGKLDAELSYRENVLNSTNTMVERNESGETQSGKYAEILSGISEYTEPSEIDALEKSGIVDEGQSAEAKELLRTKKVNAIKSAINSGYTDNTEYDIESAYNSGAITEDDRQSLYVELINRAVLSSSSADDASAIIKEMNDYLDAGKITQNDYDSEISYIKKKMGITTIHDSQTECKMTFNATSMQSTYTITYNGTKYYLYVNGGKEDNENIQGVLSKMNENPKIGSLAVYDGRLYIWTGSTTRWWVTNGKYSDKLKTVISSDGDSGSSAPQHSVTKASSTSTTSTGNNFQIVQEYITKNGLREGDRARWGQAFKFATLPDGRTVLEAYNSLSSTEQAALKGKTD